MINEVVNTSEKATAMELVKLDFSSSETPTVSGRALHEALGVKTAYKDWFPRMCEYGFTEGEDFCSNLSESTGGRPSTDHQLSISMAKELCMIQRSEKGKMFRQYFIKIEEAWNSPEMVMKRALEIATAKVNTLELKIEEQRPLVEFAEHVTNSSDCLDMGEFAKVVHDENIQMGRNKLFDWLRDNGYFMKGKTTPYQKYIDNGWFNVVEVTKQSVYGSKVFPKTVITGIGQVNILEKLRKEFAA